MRFGILAVATFAAFSIGTAFEQKVIALQVCGDSTSSGSLAVQKGVHSDVLALVSRFDINLSEFNEQDVAKVVNLYNYISTFADPGRPGSDMSIFKGILEILHFARDHSDGMSLLNYWELYSLLNKYHLGTLREARNVVQRFWPVIARDIDSGSPRQINEQDVIKFARALVSSPQIRKFEWLVNHLFENKPPVKLTDGYGWVKWAGGFLLSGNE